MRRGEGEGEKDRIIVLLVVIIVLVIIIIIVIADNFVVALLLEFNAGNLPRLFPLFPLFVPFVSSGIEEDFSTLVLFSFFQTYILSRSSTSKEERKEKRGRIFTTLSNTLNYQFSIADYTSKVKKKKEIRTHRINKTSRGFTTGTLFLLQLLLSRIHIITIIDRDRRSIMISFHPIMI